MQSGVNLMSTRVINHLKTPLFWNSYMLIIMRASATVFGFVLWAVAARMMAADQVGLASAIMSSVTLLASVGQLGLGFGLVRHVAHSKNVNGLLNIVFLLTCGAGFLFSAIFLGFLETWSPALLPLRDNAIFLILFILLVIGWTQSNILNWVFVAMRKTVYSLTRQTSHMFSAVVLLLIMLPFSADYTTILIAHVLAVWISVGLSFHVMPKVHPDYRFSFSLKEAYQEFTQQRVASYSIINFIAEQFNRIPDSILPLLIVNILGPSKGAYFFVAWMIGRALPTWVSAVSQSLFAEGAQDPAKAAEYTRKTIGLALALCTGPILLVFFAGELILSVYGADYVAEGLMLLYVITVSAVPSVLLSILASVLRIHDQLRSVFILRVAGNGLAVPFCYLGMSWYGLVGVGVGWLATQLVVTIGAGLWWWYYQKNALPSGGTS